jgi:hypothetical protein
MKRPARRFPTLATIVTAGLTAAGLAGLGPAPARGEEAFACGPKDVHGIAPADAETAVRLVCDAIRSESGGRGRYEVSVGTLGRIVILSVERLDTRRTETARLEGIEEVDVAAARLARALVRGEAFTSTQRVDNLLEDETRAPKVKRGSVKFTASILDLETPGFGARATGFSLGLQYATPRFALPIDLRFAFDDNEYPARQVGLFSVSLGGRFFPGRTNFSPFVGAGLGMLWLDANEGPYPGDASGDPYFAAESLVAAPYVEVGVEALRLHRGRIALFVRADLPLSAMESPEIVYYDWDPRTNAPGPEKVLPGVSRYVVPVSIGVSVAF